jgi:hypothetical protein
MQDLLVKTALLFYKNAFPKLESGAERLKHKDSGCIIREFHSEARLQQPEMIPRANNNALKRRAPCSFQNKRIIVWIGSRRKKKKKKKKKRGACGLGSRKALANELHKSGERNFFFFFPEYVCRYFQD